MTINKHNYESYLLDYVDGELPEAEQKLLLQYIATHPGLEEELQWLQKTRPETTEAIPFPDKTLLYRKEDSRKKVFIFPWKKMAVAAAAAACLFLIFHLYFNQDKQSPTTKKMATTTTEQPASPVKTIKPERKNAPANQETKKMEKKTGKKILAVAHNNTGNTNGTAVPRKQNATSGKDSNRAIPVHKPDPPVLAQIEIQPVHPTESQWAAAPTGQMMEPMPSNVPVKKTGPVSQRILADNTPISITGTLQTLNAHKHSLDSSFTDKLITLHEKLSHPIKALNIKKIKIGNLSLVFN